MNYAELLSNIQDYLENTETTFVADIPVIVQQAEDKIYHDAQFPDLTKNQTGSFTSGNQYLTLPTDFLWPQSLEVIDGSSNSSFLLQKEMTFIRSAYPNASTNTGLPKYYSFWDKDTYLVGPTPDSNYTTNIAYGYKPESIVTASTSWLGDNCESALLNACLVEGYKYMKGEEDMINLYNAEYAAAMQRLDNLGKAKLRSDFYRNQPVRHAVR